MGTRTSVTSLRRSRFWKMVAMLGGLAAIASVGITACHDEIVAPSARASTLARNPHGALGPLSRANVGEYHNQFLDFAFPRVAEAVSGGADRGKVCRAIAKAMREFVVMKKIRRDGSGISDGIGGAYCADLDPAASKGGARRSLAGDGVPIPELDALVEEMAIAVAENRPISELRDFFNQKIAYARATFPAEEADVAEATASVALSSAEYWDANYASQESELRAAMQEAYSRGEVDGPMLLTGGARFAHLQAPSAPLRDGWLTRIRESSWYPKARKIGGSDMEGALRGALAAAKAGPSAMVQGALVVGGGASVGELIRHLL